MCWRPLRKRELLRHVALKNIHVFKVAKLVDTKEKRVDLGVSELGIYSYYNLFKYNIGQLYKVKIKTNDLLGDFTISEGLHSYSKKNKIVLNDYRCRVLNGSDKGKSIDSFCFNKNLVVLDCIIPRGSVYYKNSDGEIVSNKLIVKDFTSLCAGIQKS